MAFGVDGRGLSADAVFLSSLRVPVTLEALAARKDFKFSRTDVVEEQHKRVC